MNECSLIVLGATGDLSQKKIFPALYALFAQGTLNTFFIVGAAIDLLTPEQFLERLHTRIAPEDKSLWEQFCARITYQPIDVHNESDFSALVKVVNDHEKKFELAGNRIVYCAIAPYLYCTATSALAKAGLLARKDAANTPWHRIVYEKPFGHDYASAKKMNECIAHYFNEQQVYRIDHYLSKELVANITVLRFTNLIFEPLWNNQYIDQVHIVFDETIGVERRGAFYDAYGALADVMQNHMMQLLALIAMEAPERLESESIRKHRAAVLSQVKVIDGVLGQYAGYRYEKEVNAQSTTETFAQVCLRIENKRWAGVPFFLRTGKCLQKKETAIYIKFKQVDCLLAKGCPSPSNMLLIRIAPEPSVVLTLNTKKPGTQDQVMPVHMHFCRKAFSSKTTHAYEMVFEEIFKGDTAISVRFDEIESAWRIIDAIHALQLPVHSYDCGSAIEEEPWLQHFAAKHGMKKIINQTD